MTSVIRDILTQLRHELERLYGDRLKSVLLYGSHSRQQAVEGSDIDVMVVLGGDVRADEEVGRTLACVAELSLAHDVVISCQFVSERSYDQSASPLMLNIRREGIAV